jgi:hypothetical protein
MPFNTRLFILFLFGGTIFLTLSWYDNGLNVVDSKYYRHWERTYERVVVARLAKSRQDGVFSAGGLLGLADVKGWNFDIDQQYELYEAEKEFEHYTVYKSNPGVQGVVFSAIAYFTNFTPAQNIAFLRIFTTIFTALILALISALLAIEFGWLSAMLVLLFSTLSEWMILPSGNAYWNLWSFYLPFLMITLLLSRNEKDGLRSKTYFYWSLYLATLVKLLFSGFELITTTVVMTTVPIVYYAIKSKWNWKLFVKRGFFSAITMLLAIGTALIILIIQIAAVEGGLSNSLEHLSDTLDKRASGTSEKYTRDIVGESINVSVFVVIKKYLQINAFNTQTKPLIWQIPYWKMIVLIFGFSITWLIQYQRGSTANKSARGIALLTATWFSIIAPLSWFVIFKPTSYIHTFLFPMAWQMPFTLLGFALCGFVITDLFRIQST